MNRLLFIGNGFDIAHNKCTKYMDFLYACAKLINKDDFKYNISDEYKTNLDKVTDNFIERYNTKEIKKQILSNLWIQHFFNICNECGKDWVDFEKEIQNLCKNKIYYEQLLPSKKKTQGEYNMEHYCDTIFDQHTLKFCETKKLSEHLSNLMELLNKYLLIVDEMESDCYSPNVLWFAPTNVISFNYTNTFKNAYYKDCRNDYIDFIHGRIGENENNIVLGFNKLDDDNYTVEYADFLKIYQRVNKNVEINVFNRISNNFVSRNRPTEKTYSMFFGHSLDVTDENIIKEAIKVSIKVYILYYDDKHKASMIKNLLKMYLRDEFERLCLSYNHKVVFVKQHPMCYDVDKDKLNNYFKNIDIGTNDNIGEYIKSKEFEGLNLSIENYAYLFNKLPINNEYDNNRNKIEEYLCSKSKESQVKDRYVYNGNDLMSLRAMKWSG